MKYDEETGVWGCDDSVYVPPDAHFEESQESEEEGEAFEEEKKHLSWRVGLLTRYGPLIPLSFMMLYDPVHAHLDALFQEANLFDPWVTAFLICAGWILSQTGWFLGYLYGRRKFKRNPYWNAKEEVRKFLDRP